MNGGNMTRTTLRTLSLFLWASVWSVSCGNSSETSNNNSNFQVEKVKVAQLHYQIVEEGQGDASELPLDPLVPGQLLLDTDSMNYSRAVTGPITFDGLEVMETWHSSGVATFEANTSDGLVRYGDDEKGIPIEALLLAPASVKLGMKWTCAGREFEVTQRVEEATAWGLRPVWTIEDRLIGKDLSECTRVYVEGHGVRMDTCLSSAVFDSAIELLEPLIPIEAPKTSPAESLKVAGIQWGIPLGAQHLWGIDIDPGQSPIVVSVQGQQNTRLLWGWVEDDARTCLQVEPNGDIFERHPSPVLSDLLHGDVSVLRAAPTCPWGEFHEGQWLWVGNRHAAKAWMRPDGSGGVWYGQCGDKGSLNGKDAHLVSDTMLALMGWEGDGEPTAILWNSIGETAWGSMEPLVGQLVGGGPIFTLTPPQATNETLPIGMVMPSGLMANTTLDFDGQFGAVAIGAYFGPFYTVRATPTMRDTLMVSPGGNIDRMVLEDNGWQRQPIASVEVPYGNSGFVGGFVVPDDSGGEHLLLFTRVFPKWTFDMGDGTSEETVQPMTLAWTAPIPDEPPTRPWLSALSVTAEKIGADVRVCWPPAGEPEVDGWTLGGAAPQEVSPHFENRQCIALFRDVNKALDASEPGGMVVEGPVPGVGRMRIAMVPGAGESSNRTFGGGAPLLGGGFAASNGIFGAGGVLTKPMLLNAPYAEFYNDIGGNGLWYWVKGANDKGLHLVNRDGVNNLFGPVGGEIVAYPYGGGIVIWNEMDHSRWFHPDGTVEEVLDNYYKLYNVGYLSDGRSCGNGYDGAAEFKESVYCYSPDGEETLVSNSVDHSFGTGKNNPFYPIADRYFVNANWLGTWLVDADEQTIEPYSEATQMGNMVYAADGTLMGQLDGAWVEFTAAGPTPLELGPYKDQVTSLYVDEELLILFLNDGTTARLAR